jgi:type IV pilus assembly protein PilB
VLIDLGLVTSADVVATLAEVSGIPFVELSEEMVDREAVDAIPSHLLEEHNLMPLSLSDGLLRIAIEDFANIYLIDQIRRQTGREIDIVAATGESIRAAREACLQAQQAEVDEEALNELDLDLDMEGTIEVLEQENEDEATNLEVAGADSPVIKLVNGIILGGIRDGASDIHIELHDDGSVVRYRIDGILTDRYTPSVRLYPALVSRIKIMSNLDISERRQPQDGSISVLVDNRPVQLRVSTMPSTFGEKVVIRIMDAKQGLADLEYLGFDPEMLGSLQRLVHQPNGIVLVTGPTGSGKSTTLYAALREIHSEQINISTVEDPVEFDLPRVNQFNVNPKAGFDFASALRALLRQDPDVVMVGEIRDKETAQIATQAALTGHLVLSTLHTNDAPGAVTRMVNIGVEPFMLAAALRGVLAQRLAKKLCPHCKVEEEISPAVRRMMDHAGADAEGIETLFRGEGCPKCRHTGYSGRIGVYELLIPDDAFFDAVTQGASLQELRKLAIELGSRPLRSDGWAKVRAGVTSVESLLEIVA